MEAAADGIPALRTTDPEPGLAMDVATLLARLSEQHRQVITLFYLEQKAYEEVAQMLGIPLGTVKTLIFRAKKELLRLNARSMPEVPTEALRSHTNPKPIRIATDFGGLPKPRILPNLMPR